MDQTLHEVGHERQVHRIDAPTIVGGEPVTLVPEDAEPYVASNPDHASFDRMAGLTVKELRAQSADLDLPRSLRKPELIAAIKAARTPERQAG